MLEKLGELIQFKLNLIMFLGVNRDTLYPRLNFNSTLH